MLSGGLFALIKTVCKAAVDVLCLEFDVPAVLHGPDFPPFGSVSNLKGKHFPLNTHVRHGVAVLTGNYFIFTYLLQQITLRCLTNRQCAVCTLLHT